MHLCSAALAMFCLLVLLCLPAAGQRQPFSDDLGDPSPWRTNAATSSTRQVAQPRDGAAWALAWVLPAMQPGIYHVQRPLPTGIDDTYVLRVAVHCSAPTALELQLASDGEARLYHIEQLREAGWHSLSIDVGSMGRFAGFTDANFSGPLFLRFWVDGSPNWAGGTVPRETPLTFQFADISLRSALSGLPADISAQLSVRPDEVTGHVNPHVYGQFLEHIYHSVESGLFGELLCNRAFTGPNGFTARDGLLQQSSLDTDIKTFAGDAAWTDYEFSFKARKTGGREGFLVLFRAADEDNFCWWNLGGWGNVRHALEIEQGGQRRIIPPGVDRAVEQGKWYDIRVRVEGDHVEGWLDGEKLLDVRDSMPAAGRVGLGTWATQAEFRDLKVTALDVTPLPLDFAAGLKTDAVAD